MKVQHFDNVSAQSDLFQVLATGTLKAHSMDGPPLRSTSIEGERTHRRTNFESNQGHLTAGRMQYPPLLTIMGCTLAPYLPRVSYFISYISILCNINHWLQGNYNKCLHLSSLHWVIKMFSSFDDLFGFFLSSFGDSDSCNWKSFQYCRCFLVSTLDRDKKRCLIILRRYSAILLYGSPGAGLYC